MWNSLKVQVSRDLIFFYQSSLSTGENILILCSMYCTGTGMFFFKDDSPKITHSLVVRNTPTSLSRAKANLEINLCKNNNASGQGCGSGSAFIFPL